MLVLSEGKNSFGRPKIDHVLRYNFIEERADFQAVFLCHGDLAEQSFPFSGIALVIQSQPGLACPCVP